MEISGMLILLMSLIAWTSVTSLASPTMAPLVGQLSNQATDVQLIPKGTYTAITTAGTFPFQPTGGGTVSFSGQATWTNNTKWGPQQLFDNTRTIYDWCNNGASALFGRWTFPRNVKISKIFMVPRASGPGDLPATITLTVDGTTIGTYSPTSISNADGLAITYSGTGFYITPNISGRIWLLTAGDSTLRCVGELEFWGH